MKDDKDAQIESKACNVNNMSDDDPVSLDPVSRGVRDEHDVLRDEQTADPTLERAWVWAQKNECESVVRATMKVKVNYCKKNLTD